MPITRVYQCPDCEAVFRELHMTRDEPPPSFCPKCGINLDDIKPELPSVNIGGSNMSKSIDQTYRAMENSPAKLTDMRSNLRMGDVAAPPLPASAQRLAAVQKEMGGGWVGGPSNVQGTLAGVKGQAPQDTGLGILDHIKANPPRGPHKSVVVREN